MLQKWIDAVLDFLGLVRKHNVESPAAQVRTEMQVYKSRIVNPTGADVMPQTIQPTVYPSFTPAEMRAYARKTGIINPGLTRSIESEEA